MIILLYACEMFAKCVTLWIPKFIGVCNANYVSLHTYIQTSYCTGNSEDKFGAWSTEGCREVMREGNRRVCECTQLAHFGILFVRRAIIKFFSMNSNNFHNIIIITVGLKSKATNFH